MIHILHIYPELLNLYGEYANLSLLSRYLKEEGAEVSITTLTLGEALPATGYDMLYLGCGTEDASIQALKALHPFRHILKDYWASGALILATGNSFDLFGQSITDEREGCFDGLSLFDYTVTRTRKTRGELGEGSGIGLSLEAHIGISHRAELTTIVELVHKITAERRVSDEKRADQ